MDGVTVVPHVRRLKTLKRGREGKENQKNEMILQTVMGVTVTTNAGLSTSPVSGVFHCENYLNQAFHFLGTVAYAAGCTVVLVNNDTNRQHHLISPDRKSITCLCWSDDGRYLVTGECGKKPCVRVWDLQDMSVMGALSGHKFGISCVAFAPDSKYVVSVGFNINSFL